MHHTTMAGLLKAGSRPLPPCCIPCSPSTPSTSASSAVVQFRARSSGITQDLLAAKFLQSAAAGTSRVVCYAKRSAAADGGDEEPEPQPRRRSRKPKAEVEAEAAETEAPAPSKARRSRKAAAEQEEQPAPPAVAMAPEPPAPQPASDEPTAAAAEEEEPVAEAFEEEAVEQMEGPTAVLEQAVRRRGRPRVLDEYAPPTSPLDDEADEEAPLIISSEVVEALKDIEPGYWAVQLRPEEYPKTWAEQPYAEALLSNRFWRQRRVESKAVEELAWQHHHHQNRYAANRYLTVRRVARLMAEVENHDYMRETDAPHHIPPWARAENVFKHEFEEFNEYVKEKMAGIGSLSLRMEEEEEARDRMDQLDMLNPASSRIASGDLAKIERASTEALLMEQYLDNILPGATLSSMSEAFADDIFADGDVEDDVEETVETPREGLSAL